MSASTSTITSRYGRTAIEWDATRLGEVLSQLRSKRKSIGDRYQMPDNDADTAELLREAEAIKHEATNHIHEARSSA